jgi:hypothetical protein
MPAARIASEPPRSIYGTAPGSGIGGGGVASSVEIGGTRPVIG